MSDLLPSSPDPGVGDDGDPRVIGVDSEDAADLLSALQSDTARAILTALYDDPGTPSNLAERADTSIQNVRYHLQKLEAADLVEVGDTVYSEKGREMNVYVPVSGPLVVFAGNDDEAPGLEAALSRLLGALGALGLSSLLIQRLFGDGALWDPPTVGFSSSSGDAAEATTAASDSGVNVTHRSGDATTEEAATAEEAATTAEDATTAAETADDGTVTGEAPRTATESGGDGATEATRTVAETTTESMETAAQTTVETTRTVTETVVETTQTAAQSGGTDALASLPPGLLFFAGGVAVLAAFAVWQRLETR